MTSRDLVLDALTRIKNGLMVDREFVMVKKSKLVKAVLEKILEYKFLNSLEEENDYLKVELAYKALHKPRITVLKRISKFGLRQYTPYKKITPVLGGRGMYVLSTSKGILSGKEAYKARVGGEVICKIW